MTEAILTWPPTFLVATVHGSQASSDASGAPVSGLCCLDRLMGQQSADRLSWFHIVTLMTKLQKSSLRDWYAREALTQSWPRDTLSIQIKNRHHLRQV